MKTAAIIARPKTRAEIESSLASFKAQPEQDLEFGRRCLAYKEKHGDLAAALSNLDIPLAAANYWMARAENDVEPDISITAPYVKNLYNNIGRNRTKTTVGETYFIQDEGTKCIKIGWATDALQRLDTLQTGNPNELTLLATRKGGAKDEGKLHRRFKHLCVRGEWFRPTQELLDFIESTQ